MPGIMEEANMNHLDHSIPPAPGVNLAVPPEGPAFPKSSAAKITIDTIRRRFNKHGKFANPGAKKPGSPEDPEKYLQAEMTVEAAMPFLLTHKNFTPAFYGGESDDEGDGNPRTFPSFDNLDNYSIPESVLEALWLIEADRLVSGIQDPNADILFPDMGDLDTDYTLLSSLVREILFLGNICLIDNEGTCREHMPNMHQREAWDSSRDFLRRKVANAAGGGGNKKASFEPDSHHSLTKEQRQTFIYALIDLVSLTLARILVYSASHELNWGYTCVVCLAKYATKLKVMSRDPIMFASKSLDAADDVARIVHPVKTADKDASSQGSAGKPPQEIPERLRQDINNPFVDRMESMYYGAHQMVRLQIADFWDFVLNGLLGRTHIAATRTKYEICSVVYETGLERFRTWVYQERDGDLQATACQKTLPMARPAFELLRKTAEALEAKQRLQPPQSLRNEPVKTHVHWNDISSNEAGNSSSDPAHRDEGHDPDHKMIMRNLEEVITILVPLVSVSPRVLASVPRFFQMVTLTFNKLSGIEKPPLPAEAGKFKAFFCMLTDDPGAANARTGREDTSSLSHGLMTRDNLLRGPKIAEIRGKSFPLTDRPRKPEEHDAVIEARAQANRKMNEWVYEENAVIVSCKVYVWSTMALSSLLAVGGVVIGFNVGDRIQAVDPFNMTTYCWVLAAFIILVAKSVRVETWPWRDFLRGRVRCRSVSELHSVTRIPEPLIMCKLLEAEDTTILNTRGPYNAAFQRRNDGGFSIDRPLTMWTMLLSGLIMVKVSTVGGPALVCLDVRRGTKFDLVGYSQFWGSRTTERLACVDLTRSDGLLPLKRQNLEWRGVLGLYNNRNAKFV